jgi:Zn-dependent M28 family amino/carboxypeptidase
MQEKKVEFFSEGVKIAGILRSPDSASGPRPARSLVFAAWTAEEKGLLGADYFAAHPVQPLAQVVAVINLDPHVVLPAATWLEKSGTMTNSERRIGLLNPAATAPGEALPDSEILCRFATAMGFGKGFAYTHPAQIFAEHAALKIIPKAERPQGSEYTI